MFARIAAFEFRYQLGQPLFWITFAVFFLLTFGSVTVDQIQIGSGGNTNVNAPFAIIQTLLIMSIFAMFVTTAFVANVVIRDDETGFGGIVRSTRVNKADYLLGRFLGAFAVAAIVFCSVPLALMVGSVMPWLDPETLGPFNFNHYAYSTVVFGLPNLFLCAALFFSVATLTRSMMATYVAVAGFLVAYLTAVTLFAKPEYRGVLGIVEPFGFSAFATETRYWTPAQRNSELPTLANAILYNRLLMVAIGAAFLAAAYAAFSFEGKSGARAEKKRKLAQSSEGPSGARRAPRVAPDPKAGFGQLVLRTRFEATEVARNPAFIVLLLIGVFNALGSLMGADELFGTPVRAVSRVMIDTVRGAFTLFPLLIAIYYAGELVWRERDKRVHELIGASPAPDWSLMVPKLLALMVVLVGTMLTATATAAIVQVIKQYPVIEFWNYLTWYIVPSTVDMFILAALAVFVQALVPSKFIGYGVMLLYVVLTLVASQMGFNHNLLIYGSAPGEPLSDMNGAGAFQVYAYVFRAYWSAIALALLVLSYALWRRGADVRLMPRLARLGRRLTGGAGLVFGGSLVTAALIGGFAFYNTNILNEYRNRQDGERYQAAMEKQLLPFETLPQPRVTDVTLALDVRPRDTWVDVTGSYVLENRTLTPLSEIHVRFDRDVTVSELAIEGAREKKLYKRFNYRIFALQTPMAPGERRKLTFKSSVGQKGFRNSENSTRIVENGTFLNNFEFAPVLGMSRQGLLQDRATRRRYGLPPELRVAKLEDLSAQANNYLREDSDWVTGRVTIVTDADQIAIAPGRLIEDRIEGARRSFTYVTDAPIQHFFSVQSGRYEVATDRWNNVDLAVYYHRPHDFNVGRMMQAMKDSLSYYSENFSPYQFKQARIIEFPAYATFAQAFANTMPYSEAIGFIADNRDPDDIDYAYYVTAHEVAHQWWAHQVIGANMQGVTVMSETLAQYSALMVMKKTYGEDQIRRFLKFELDNYLTSRGSEVLEELPLYRVEDQGYIYYRKGSLVMYLLQDQIGEAAVNRALARFLQAHAFKGAPYPRSVDLIALLREEAGPEHQGLITDLFEKITLYDQKVEDAVFTAKPDGTYDVTFKLSAKKLYADGQGVETEAPIAEPMEIGVFTAEPGRGAFSSENVVLRERRPIVSGEQTITLTGLRVPKSKGAAPSLWVGVDPYNMRIDRNSSDNVIKAKAAETAGAS